MISVKKAFSIVDKAATRLATERITLRESIGRVLAEPIVADSDLPPFDRSQMDGYAVRASDTKATPVVLNLIGESAAGRGFRGVLGPGDAVRIMTGAPLPLGADAVQKLELATEDGEHVQIAEPTEKGRYIVTKGKEVKKGTVVLKSGTTITTQTITLPAAFGYAKLRVAKRPRVAILSTGSEIVDIDKKPKRDQIRNSNSVMLALLCESFGCEVSVLPPVGDELSVLKSQISKSIKTCDLLITTGGVSVGKYDLTKLAFEDLGAEIFFERVALKPGKPTVFGKVGKSFVFGLPGNPVSAAVTFHLFVRRLLLIMQGSTNTQLKSGTAIAGGEFRGTRDRHSYIPSRLITDAKGQLVAKPLRWLGSSDFVSFSEAHSLVSIAKGNTKKSGEVVDILFLF